MYLSTFLMTHSYVTKYLNGRATISRLLQSIGLFCKRALSKRLYSAKETNNFKEPTNRSHPYQSKSHIYQSTIYASVNISHDTLVCHVP